MTLKTNPAHAEWALACSVLKLRAVDIIERCVQLRDGLYRTDYFNGLHFVKCIREDLADAANALANIEAELKKRDNP